MSRSSKERRSESVCWDWPRGVAQNLRWGLTLALLKLRILLPTPAATSFDQYDSFEKRGEDFVDQVTALVGSA